MTEAAALLLTNASVHPFADTKRTAEAVAIRDGDIVRVDAADEVGFLEGVETRVIDLEGRIVLPGFIDAHTHVTVLGRYLLEADLRGAAGPEACLDRLRSADTGEGWVLGFGFDESTWSEPRDLTAEALDSVSRERPVVAVREDLHAAVVNHVVLERFRDQMPSGDVRFEAGTPTGTIVEGALDIVYAAIEPTAADTREHLLAAQEEAHRHGVTMVHDMVRRSHAPRVYRELELAGELDLRVRLNYWADHLDAVIETGLRTNHGSQFVRVGAIKTYTDGSIGARTARFSEPYADSEVLKDRGDGGEGRSTDRGEWIVAPGDLRDLVQRADGAGFQLAIHAIGDEAIDATLDALETTDSGARRHRIEHVEFATDEAIDRMAHHGVVASMQPNFHKWAGEGKLYETRLGERWRLTNRLSTMLETGVSLAFGSDGMPMDPLFGIHHAVNAPTEEQRLSVTEALRAYTAGAAYAGYMEDEVGTIEVGKHADLVVLERSPWEDPDRIDEIGVAMTVVDGKVVYDGR